MSEVTLNNSVDRITRNKNNVERECYEKLGMHYNLPIYYGGNGDGNSVIIEYVRGVKHIYSICGRPELYSNVVGQLISVVDYMHSRGIVHNQLIVHENILYQESTNRVIVVNFEHACLYDKQCMNTRDFYNIKREYTRIAYIGWLLLNNIKHEYIFTDDDPLLYSVASEMQQYINTHNETKESQIMKYLLARM